jgi:hypothetical protein|tara:strand:+ start:73 stop:558 length:486 start_codon:yes stop_codon:yes gene_type:complete
MPIYKSDGVDGVSHLPKKFVRLNTQVAASTSTTFTKGEVMIIDTAVTDVAGAGFNVKRGTGADLAITIGVCAETKTVDNSGGAAVKNDTILVQVAGHNADCTASGTAILVGDLVGMAVLEVESVGDYSSDHQTAPFALCVKAFSSDGTDGEIFIYDHGFYG